ncbi:MULTISPECIES: hypothetical protein [unclassified Francisella]|uniref:hypothetical protein n=1 Tax=unclassified Francisella TaxID=2610885 RepID=UPI002E351B88|nr:MULTISPECIES: hypothetical protein [unclassified Francisella]MED7819956.1 hypothetical protein [Francisella sp. 19S2-4]MED7830776.1 hypothetical protein [Francisella sp. 19S2-10]
MNIFRKIAATSLVSIMLVGVSFADASSEQPQPPATNNPVAEQKANVNDAKAANNNPRTSREFISPLRKNRLDRRHDRRVSMFSSDKPDASAKTTAQQVNQPTK